MRRCFSLRKAVATAGLLNINLNCSTVNEVIQSRSAEEQEEWVNHLNQNELPKDVKEKDLYNQLVSLSFFKRLFL